MPPVWEKEKTQNRKQKGWLRCICTFHGLCLIMGLTFSLRWELGTGNWELHSASLSAFPTPNTVGVGRRVLFATHFECWSLGGTRQYIFNYI